MTEKIKSIEYTPESELGRIAETVSGLLAEYGEQDWTTYEDTNSVKWMDGEKKTQVVIEQVFSYHSNEAWSTCSIQQLPQDVDGVRSNGSDKTLVLSTKRVDGERVPVAYISEYSELHFDMGGWKGRGWQADHEPTEYDLAEFDVYLAMVRREKEQMPRRQKRVAASRELGERALREGELLTSEVDFFKADFS